MRNFKKWMLATTLISGSTTVLSSCVAETDNPAPANPEVDQDVMNKRITDGNYDKSLAVKCINGTFVGKKTENIISYKGIPFVGQQPLGNLRWKAPVEFTSDNGVYEAYNYGKAPVQSPGDPSTEYGTSENCLYLNIWKTDEADSASSASCTCPTCLTARTTRMHRTWDSWIR